mmetsp:Transcript_34732/g.76025  ORF Transcript_34732/g.76025 Transcript_34732/m.76025 type:complete len:223 (+) Transcript_34732:1149-1817(+)
MDLGILIEGNLALRLARVVLHVGNLETAAGEGVDLVNLQHVVELIDSLLEEGGADVGAGRVQHFDAEQTALPAGIGPVLDVSFGGNAGADGPTVHVEVELGDGDDVLTGGGGVANNGSGSAATAAEAVALLLLLLSIGVGTTAHAAASISTTFALHLSAPVGVLRGGIGGIVKRLSRSGGRRTTSGLDFGNVLDVGGIANLLSWIRLDDVDAKEDDDVLTLD